MGEEDPVDVLATDGLDTAYDEDLVNALRVDQESNDSSNCFNASDTYEAVRSDPALNAFEECSRKIAPAVSSLASALEELKDESAATLIHHLSDGEDFSVEDYVDTITSGERSLEAYTQETDGREITDLAVSLLVDCSGSMCGAESAMAYTTSCLVATACEEANVPTEIAAFSTGGMLVLKSFEEENADCITRLGILHSDIRGAYNRVAESIGLWGGTDLEGALPLLFGRLRKYDGKACKLAFVITDGDTGDASVTGKLVRDARQEGIVVIGIGIGTSLDELRKCFGHCQVFDTSSLGRLPQYVADEIREAMASNDFLNY